MKATEPTHLRDEDHTPELLVVAARDVRWDACQLLLDVLWGHRARQDGDSAVVGAPGEVGGMSAACKI